MPSVCSARPTARTAVVSLFVAALVALGTAGVSNAAPAASSPPAAADADQALDAAILELATARGGPPGVAVVVQRGAIPVMHTAGVADVAAGKTWRIDDHQPMASVSQAYNGAAALALLGEVELDIDATIADVRPDLPAAWGDVTLAQLLQHTSGIPDFSTSKDFRAAVAASPDVAPPPAQLLAYISTEPLAFTPGTRYHYSNSDNVIVGLMVEAVTGTDYATALSTLVYGPLGLTSTSLPRDAALPAPYVHGYVVDPAAGTTDVSEAFAAGWAWASGGIVATAADANRFVRGYVHGDETSPLVMLALWRSFRSGSSDPPGPGTNSAGLGQFRYVTRCGTVYGHTGHTTGFTQFVAATRDAKRSTTVSVNAQITPKSDPARFADLRRLFTLAVCAALADE